ncbi:MAG: sulfite exporter TauE/SafE family protein [Chloroflexota bacterium]
MQGDNWTKTMQRWLYPVLLIIVNLSWLTYMTLSNSWHLFQTLWPISLTMVFGSFVAGATAGGGAAVAFPVFTKILQISTADARTFGLMIQSVGMMMATVIIFVRRVPILPQVILWTSLGGVVGQILGTYTMIIPPPFPKLLFTFVATAFGVAWAVARWVFNWRPVTELAVWNGRQRAHFFVLGIIGGIFSANTGAGIDMLVFVVLTLAFSINEKISTPTSVIIMGINSVVGFFLHGVVSNDIGVVWTYWLVAIPIVVLGAPLGAYFASKVSRDHIIALLLFLISLELITTLVLIPFTTISLVVTAVTVLVAICWFSIMLRYRYKQILLRNTV